MGRQDAILSWEVGLGVVSGKGISGMSGIVEYAVLGDLLKAWSLALCCNKNSYISSLDKSARGWPPSFYQNLELFSFLLVMMTLDQNFLDENFSILEDTSSF